jgi:hypothetical protein
VKREKALQTLALPIRNYLRRSVLIRDGIHRRSMTLLTDEAEDVVEEAIVEQS